MAMLFKGDMVKYFDTIVAGSLFAIYFAFIIALLFYISSLVKKGIIAGLIVILFSYISPSIGSMLPKLKNWVPYNLLQQAMQLKMMDQGAVIQTILVILLYIIILQWLTIRRMKRVEVI